MNKLFVNEGMLKTKSDLDIINADFDSMFNDINTNLDSIVLNWKGNKSNTVLAPVSSIKDKNTEIITRIKGKADEIKNAYEIYLKNTDTTIEVASSSSTIPIVSTLESSTIQTDKVTGDPLTTPSYTSSPGFMSPTSYVNDYLNKAIEYAKTGGGASPFDSEDMMSLSSLYNNTPNIRTQGESFFNDYNKNLKIIENKLKENGLWGTPEASAVLMHYTVKTGFRIPTAPTTKTDGVGNYRHLGANVGWLNNGNGMDCNNVLAWVAINSGRMKENQHIDVPKKNSSGTILLDKKDFTGKSLYDLGIRPGDNAGRKGHATVFMHEDDKNIYVFESVSNVAATETRKLYEGGTMITVIPKNPNDSIDKSISVKYPRSHINFFVPFESIPQIYNPADPETIKK